MLQSELAVLWAWCTATILGSPFKTFLQIPCASLLCWISSFLNPTSSSLLVYSLFCMEYILQQLPEKGHVGGKNFKHYLPKNKYLIDSLCIQFEAGIYFRQILKAFLHCLPTFMMAVETFDTILTLWLVLSLFFVPYILRYVDLVWIHYHPLRR